MINANERPFFSQSGVVKNLKLTFPKYNSDGTNFVIDNDNLYEQECTLHESLCSTESLKLGACEASELTVTMAYSSIVVPSLVGKTCNVTLEIKSGLEANARVLGTVPFGAFKITEDTHDAARTKRILKGYDLMKYLLELDVTDWYNSIYTSTTVTKTIKQLRNSFFVYAGVSQKAVNLVNDNLYVSRSLDASGSLTGKDFLTELCEINGVFGHIGRDGVFRYIELEEYLPGIYPDPKLFPSTNLYPEDTNIVAIYNDHNGYKECTYEDYICKKLDIIQVCREEGDVGGSYAPKDSAKTNGYKIIGNLFAIGATKYVYTDSTGATQTITNYTKILDKLAEEIYNVVKNITYMPSKLTVYGDPCVEVGDTYRCVTVEGQDVISYVLQRTLTGIQSLTDVYESTGTEYSNHDVKNTDHKDIIKLKGRANILTRTVELFQSEIYDASGNSKIAQNASAITAEVTRATAEEGKLSASIKINADAIKTKVEDTNNGTSFGWEMKSTYFKLKSGGADVMTVNKDGLKLVGNGTFTGQISATSGTFGGSNNALKWTIGRYSYKDDSGNTLYGSSIHSGEKTSINADANGVYIGTNGISLGNRNTEGKTRFRVDSDGSLYCSNATIEGKITATSGTIGGCTITNNTLMIESAHIGNLSADKITSGTFGDARIPSLGASKITSGSFADARIPDTCMRTKDFTAENINGKFVGATWFRADDIKVGNSILMDWAGKDARAFKPVSMNGYYVLATPLN